jgi:hypothetical protein
MKLSMIAFLVAFVTNCGTYKVPETKVETVDENGMTKDERESYDKKQAEEMSDKANKAAPAREATDKPATESSTDPAVSVEVTVNVSVNGASKSPAKTTPATGPTWKVVTLSLMNWYAASENAPDGYRLPTRGEMTEAFDAGTFKDFDANLMFWTSTEPDWRSQPEAIVFGAYGAEADTLKIETANAIYIRK